MQSETEKKCDWLYYNIYFIALAWNGISWTDIYLKIKMCKVYTFLKESRNIKIYFRDMMHPPIQGIVFSGFQADREMVTFVSSQRTNWLFLAVWTWGKFAKFLYPLVSSSVHYKIPHNLVLWVKTFLPVSVLLYGQFTNKIVLLNSC